jgi:hydrogenase maturation protease
MIADQPNGPRILIAGVGNIFLGDDAFGVEVVQRLSCRPLPKGVRVVDFGIRGLDLAYALLDDYEAVILVDAMPRGGQPGTLYVLEQEMPSNSAPAEGAPQMQVHNLDPAQVLGLVVALGGHVQRLIVVGCEPETPSDDVDMPTELSAPVRAAVNEAVLLVQSLIARLLADGAATEVANPQVLEVNSIPRKEFRACLP